MSSSKASSAFQEFVAQGDIVMKRPAANEPSAAKAAPAPKKAKKNEEEEEQEEEDNTKRAIQKRPAAKYDYGDRYKEQTKAFGRMKTALKKDPAAKAKWQEIEDLKGRESGKNMKKQMFLFAYEEGLEVDGQPFGSSFWEEVEEIKTKDEKAIQGIWVTQGRLELLVGVKEAQEMILGKELREKTNDKGRKVFWWCEESGRRTVSKNNAYSTKGNRQITNAEAEDAKNNFKKLKLGQLQSWSDDEKEDENDDNGHGAIARTEAKGKGKGKKKKIGNH